MGDTAAAGGDLLNSGVTLVLRDIGYRQDMSKLAGTRGLFADRLVSKLSGLFPYTRPMRRFLIPTVLAAALLPGAVMAQGRSQGNAPETPPGAENRPEIERDVEDRVELPSGNGNRPDTPPGLENRGESGPGAPSPNLEDLLPGGNPPAQDTSEEDQALEAVQAGRAVPFDRVLSQAQSATGGDLIDTRLMTVDGFLLYELRMLQPDGTVDRLYYYASTGNRVTTR